MPQNTYSLPRTSGTRRMLIQFLRPQCPQLLRNLLNYIVHLPLILTPLSGPFTSPVHLQIHTHCRRSLSLAPTHIFRQCRL